MSKVIVGLQVGITSGCAVYRDGAIEFAVSEERYSRIKNDTSFPDLCIAAALKECKLTSSDIESVILVSQNMSPDHFLINRECSFSVEDYLREQYDFYKPKYFDGKNPDYLDIFSHYIDHRYTDLLDEIRTSNLPKAFIWNRWRIARVSRLFGISPSKVTIVNHEFAHAAYAYYGSPFRGNDVLAITFDGFGDSANATVSTQVGTNLQVLHRYRNYNIGRIYRFITLLLGMKPNEHEYKVMGLAPYASEFTYFKALQVFSEAYKFSDTGTIQSNSELKDHFFYFKDRLESCRFDGIAAGLQMFTETMNCDLVRYWAVKLGKKRICLSGGVSLNVKANMEIGKLDCVQDLYVVGSGGDESLCIAGIYAYLDLNLRGAEILPLPSLYLGSTPTHSDVTNSISILRNNMNVNVVEDASPYLIASRIAEGSILGRVSGQMEFGARALGNRSIIADPRSPLTIKKINSKIKKRDFWMPFTPSILPSSATKYLYNPKNLQFPFMSVACKTTTIGRQHLPAAIHPADYTARPQIVDSSSNSSYFKLLLAFEEITGVGALLNTSFNLHGLPIVRSVEDAVYVLENSNLDGIILSNFLVHKV